MSRGEVKSYHHTVVLLRIVGVAVRLVVLRIVGVAVRLLWGGGSSLIERRADS